MSKILFPFVLTASVSGLSAQTLFVDTLPHNKNVLIEEFTGVQCNSCPQGHIEIQNLLNAYPGRVFAAGMHSFNTGHTDPYPGDEDLRRTFPDQLYPQIGDFSGLPSGILSRRKWNNNKEAFIFWPFASYHGPIDSCVNVIMSEPSPFNIGIMANYDTVNKMLYVTSQIYTTSTTSGTFRLNAYFTQSNIFVSQLNGSTVIPNYNEKHVFREILTPTWGTGMYTGISNAGQVHNSTVTFNNSVKNYKMEDVEVIVFVTNHAGISSAKGVVIQSFGVPVNKVGATSTAIAEQEFSQQISVWPNPSADHIYIHLDQPLKSNEVIIRDLHGKALQSELFGEEREFRLDHHLPAGVYMITVNGQASKLVIY